MDIKKGVKNEMWDEIAAGIQNSAIFIPCLSVNYQKSEICKKELSLATFGCKNKPTIIPVICATDKHFKLDESEGTALLVAGSEFRSKQDSLALAKLWELFDF